MGLVLGQFVSLLITSTAFSSSELARRGPSLACFSLFFRFGCLLFRRFVCRNAVRVGFFWVLFGSNLVKRVVDLRRRLSSFDAYFSFFWTICSSKDNKGGFFLSFLEVIWLYAISWNFSLWSDILSFFSLFFRRFFALYLGEFSVKNINTFWFAWFSEVGRCCGTQAWMLRPRSRSWITFSLQYFTALMSSTEGGHFRCRTRSLLLLFL